MPSDGERYNLELERVRVRALLAAERFAAAPDAGACERLERQLAEVEAALVPERAVGRAHALAERLGLLDEECDLLWTAVALAADPRVLGPMIAVGGSDAVRGLSPALYARQAGLDPSRARMLLRRLLAPNPLLGDGLLEWAREDEVVPTARPLVAPLRTIGWLACLDAPDERMRGAARVVLPPSVLDLDGEQEATLRRLRPLLEASSTPLVAIEGSLGSGRATAVATAARELGRRVVALDLRRLPRGPAVLEGALLGLRRECRLRDAVPLVTDLDELVGGDDGGALRVLGRAIDAWQGPFAVTSSLGNLELPVQRTLARVRWTVPDVATRRTLWARAIGDDATRAIGGELDQVAMRYRLGAGSVRRAAEAARLVAADAPLAARHLIEGVRVNIAERLGELAVRTEVKQRWDDLVLAPDILDQVKALVARVRHAHRVLEDWGFAGKVARGGGIAALFSGPPGTGKTMVAGLIARELDLELYQVDLSRVMSKWIGETEKQLARIFEAADAGHALLLFDEADALFAKRTEVKSSVDRYANLEVNYLLQRIESFGGVAILTTNLDTSIDPALRRRLAANLVFWPPDLDERTLLWKGFMTPGAPIAGTLDSEALAEAYPEMTGANIRNAVVSAAFLAASEDGAISQQHLERAARAEYVAMGRVVSSTRRA